MAHLTFTRLFVVSLLCFFTQPIPAQQSIDLGSAHFAAEAQLNDSKLLLHGAGIRQRFGFKVYAAGLYTASKFNSIDVLLADPRAKRLQLIFYREVEGNELGSLFIRGIQNNAPANEEMSKIIQGASQMGDAMGVFFWRKKAAPWRCAAHRLRTQCRHHHHPQRQTHRKSDPRAPIFRSLAENLAGTRPGGCATQASADGHSAPG